MNHCGIDDPVTVLQQTERQGILEKIRLSWTDWTQTPRKDVDFGVARAVEKAWREWKEELWKSQLEGEVRAATRPSQMSLAVDVSSL